MDREKDIGFVKEVPAFHELQSVLVHRDDMVPMAAPEQTRGSTERVRTRPCRRARKARMERPLATARRGPRGAGPPRSARSGSAWPARPAHGEETETA